MCCVYLRDASMAEDAVQETFLKAYRALDSFKGDSSEKTWLYSIAMNVCRDMRRLAWYHAHRANDDAQQAAALTTRTTATSASSCCPRPLSFAPLWSAWRASLTPIVRPDEHLDTNRHAAGGITDKLP